MRGIDEILLKIAVFVLLDSSVQLTFAEQLPNKGGLAWRGPFSPRHALPDQAGTGSVTGTR